MTEENWFFRLSTFQEDLERLYEERPDFVAPDFRANEARSFIKSGLQDVSLSRRKLSWGVPLPWDPDQVMYVWFDALLNYYTALSYARPGEDLTARFWPANLHVMAKDILKFHSVYWPALLLAAGLELPDRMYVHGFLLMGEKKMSKSLGNVLDPFEVIDKFGSDALRFYCFREVSFGQDGSISTAGFEARYETELANDFGNLASRVLAMVVRYRDGVVPAEVEIDPDLADGEGGLGGIEILATGLLDRTEISRALEVCWAGGSQAEPLRGGAEAVGAGQGPRAVRRSRSRSLQPRRGSAGGHPAPARLHPDVIRRSARGARGAFAGDRFVRLPRGRPERRADSGPVPQAGQLSARLAVLRPARLRAATHRLPQ